MKSYGSPGSLCGHSAVRVANSMMIFGGEGKEDYKNELWKFNFGKIIFVSNNISNVSHQCIKPALYFLRT